MKVNQTIPWKLFDRIYIALVIIDENGNLTNSDPTDHYKILEVVSMYKKARPDGQVFVMSTFGGFMDDRYLYAADHPIVFAQSALRYFNKYDIDGLDIDWETIKINDYAPKLVTLIATCKKLFGSKYKITHTIWPNVHEAKTVGLLANIVDEVNIMSYATNVGIEQIEILIDQYHGAGFPYNKMILGIET